MRYLVIVFDVMGEENEMLVGRSENLALENPEHREHVGHGNHGDP